MIKLAELEAMWKQDAQMDKLELGEMAAGIDDLHAKYIVHLSHVRLALRSAEVAYYKMRTLRRRYYNGEMSKEEYTQLEWEPWKNNRPLKAELEELMACDEHIIRLADKLEYLKVMADTLESIVKSIQTRTWNVKNAITWTQYTQGLL